MHRIPISASLANFKTPEGIMMVKSDVKIKWDGISAEDLDLSLVDNMIRCNDIKLMRQLSHYHMGLRASDDVITQIREFYMIIDDEGEKYASFLSDYKGIRDFVSHPKIDNPYALMPNGTSFEKNYLDLSIPEATKELEKYARSLEAKAEEIIISKLMP